MRELLGRPDFRRMLVGQTVSALGDWLGTIAVMMMVLRLSGSAAAVGGVLVLQLLPSAVAAPLAARVIGRIDRREVLLACDAVRVLMAAVLPLVWAIGWVYVWAFLLQLAGLAFLPARDAAVPVLAGLRHGPHTAAEEARLSAANGLLLATYYGCIPLGAGLFALIVTVGAAAGLPTTLQFVAAFWLDALTFAVSFAAIRGIRDLGHRLPGRAGIQPLPGPATPDGPGEPSRPAAESASAARLRDLWRVPAARAVEQATLVAVLGLGALFSLGAVFVTETMGAGPLGFGALVAMFGVGAAGGLGLARVLAGRARTAQLRAAVAVQGGVIISMAVVAALPLALAGAALFGAAVAAALLNALGLLQDSLTGGVRDLALSAFHLSLRAGLAASALVTGAAADLIGPIHVPLLGTLRPDQVILTAAGIVVTLSAAAMPAVLPAGADGPAVSGQGTPAGPAGDQRAVGRGVPVPPVVGADHENIEGGPVDGDGRS